MDKRPRLPENTSRKGDHTPTFKIISILVLVILGLSFNETLPNRLICRTSDEEFIKSAISYYVKKRQPTGVSSIGANGKTRVQEFLLYKDENEFLAENPDCCKVTGLRDSEGAMFSSFEIYRYDMATTVELHARLRDLADQSPSKVELDKRKILLNSCGEVITNSRWEADLFWIGQKTNIL